MMLRGEVKDFQKSAAFNYMTIITDSRKSCFSGMRGIGVT